MKMHTRGQDSLTLYDMINPDYGSVEIDFEALFPDLEHHGICYVLHVCGLRDFPSQTRLIAFEGIKSVEDVARYTDVKLDCIADRNSKRTPAKVHVQTGLASTKAFKAITHWVHRRGSIM
jgi:hypothetical protein